MRAHDALEVKTFHTQLAALHMRVSVQVFGWIFGFVFVFHKQKDERHRLSGFALG